MLSRGWCRMRFKWIQLLVLGACALVVGCQSKVPDYKKPRPVRRVEIVTHSAANQGIPMVLEWVFIRGDAAYNMISGMTAQEFLQAEQDIRHQFPQEISIYKHTAFPGQVDVIFPPVCPLKSHIILFAHFVKKGVNRWVVLPRERLRVNIHRDTLKIQTRETMQKRRR